MAKYIDAEKLKRFVESIGLTPQKSADYNDGRDDVKMVVLDFIDSLQQEQPINTELCTLIACDVIQATTKRAIEKPQDKDKEEDLMIKKMEYLNMLEKSYFQQEQPEVDLEKAAMYVYESWMGGTMNDVRRDMVELGKVLNARKEDKK